MSNSQINSINDKIKCFPSGTLIFALLKHVLNIIRPSEIVFLQRVLFHLIHRKYNDLINWINKMPVFVCHILQTFWGGADDVCFKILSTALHTQ